MMAARKRGGTSHRTRPGTRAATACQLCNWNRPEKQHDGKQPRAVATLAGYRLCAGCLERVAQIAADAERKQRAQESGDASRVLAGVR